MSGDEAAGGVFEAGQLGPRLFPYTLANFPFLFANFLPDLVYLPGYCRLHLQHVPCPLRFLPTYLQYLPTYLLPISLLTYLPFYLHTHTHTHSEIYLAYLFSLLPTNYGLTFHFT